jgi:hypothetical protein
MTEDQLGAAAEELATKVIDLAVKEAAKVAPQNKAFGLAVGALTGALIGCAAASGVSKARLISMLDTMAEGVLE